MKLSADKLKVLCKQEQITIKKLLQEARVSRNAYYSLLRKDSVLPRSIHQLARRLAVPAADLLEDTSLEQGTKAIIQKTHAMVRRFRKADPDNIRHTLLLLQEKPVDRLRRALRRGEKPQRAK